MLDKTVLILASSLAIGCTAELDDADVAPDDARQAEIAEITENLLAAGYTEDDIEVVEMSDPVEVAGQLVFEAGPAVFVQDDVHVTLEASRELAGVESDDPSFRHWRTPTLVNNGSTICLLRAMELIPEVGPALYGVLSSDMATGVSYAASNYNIYPDIGLTFSVRDGLLDINGNVHYPPGGDTGCDFTIGIVQGWGSLGGISGFPSGGTPYGLIRLIGSANNQVFEHIATHEIGHCIGMRHTDWLTRQSCGQWVSEPQDGAVGIPGTPYHTTDSVYAACFPLDTDGELRGYDVVALETIY